MSPDTPTLPLSFLNEALSLTGNDRIRWYMCVIINLSSLNFPDVIPQVYGHFNTNVLESLSTTEARRQAVNYVREGLIKSTGVVGAARTGNSMRTLSACVPVELRETESPRSKESDETAGKRGKEFWTRIYSRNNAFDPEATVRASPDYAFVVRDVLYARVFSFDGIIDDLTTGYAMVSGLYGLDCQNQLQHHMKGMLWNGCTREDLVKLQKLCLDLADLLGVKFRHPPAPIPTIPAAVE